MRNGHDDMNTPELTPIDIFMDIDGIGFPHARWRIESRFSGLLTDIPLALKTHGFCTRTIWGVANFTRGGKTTPGVIQNWIRKVFERHGHTILWTRDVSDTHLKAEIARRLAAGSLAPAVMLLASDHDFITTVELLKSRGCFVFVTGIDVSKKLVARADKCIGLSDLLGRPLDGENSPPAPTTLINKIEWPTGADE